VDSGIWFHTPGVDGVLAVDTGDVIHQDRSVTADGSQCMEAMHHQMLCCLWNDSHGTQTAFCYSLIWSSVISIDILKHKILTHISVGLI